MPADDTMLKMIFAHTFSLASLLNFQKPVGFLIGTRISRNSLISANRGVVETLRFFATCTSGSSSPSGCVREHVFKPGAYAGFHFGRGWMASAGARAYNGGLGAVPPAVSRGRAPGGGQGAKPPKAESYLLWVDALKSSKFCGPFLKICSGTNPQYYQNTH